MWENPNAEYKCEKCDLYFENKQNLAPVMKNDEVAFVCPKCMSGDNIITERRRTKPNQWMFRRQGREKYIFETPFMSITGIKQVFKYIYENYTVYAFPGIGSIHEKVMPDYLIDEIHEEIEHDQLYVEKEYPSYLDTWNTFHDIMGVNVDSEITINVPELDKILKKTKSVEKNVNQRQEMIDMWLKRGFIEIIDTEEGFEKPIDEHVRIDNDIVWGLTILVKKGPIELGVS